MKQDHHEKVIVTNVPQYFMKVKDLEKKWKILYTEIAGTTYT